VRELVGCVNVM